MGKMENLMSKNSWKIWVLFINLNLKEYNFISHNLSLHFSMHLSVKLSCNAWDNLETFVLKFNSWIPCLVADLSWKFLKVDKKKLSARPLFLLTPKILRTPITLKLVGIKLLTFPIKFCNFCRDCTRNKMTSEVMERSILCCKVVMCFVYIP